MLYTVMPPELIFAEEDAGEHLYLTVAGATLEVEPTTPGRGKITRIISTDPGLYLHPELQPGMELKI